jgi:hypothetical protein
MNKMTPREELRALLEENAREVAKWPRWMQQAPPLFVPRPDLEPAPPRRDDSEG